MTRVLLWVNSVVIDEKGRDQESKGCLKEVGREDE